MKPSVVVSGEPWTVTRPSSFTNVDWSINGFDYAFLRLFCALPNSFSSGGETTHQQRFQGVPAPKRTRAQSSS
ncbi:hypothetical protein KC320_g50 [Hortaea werneckii]|nr:hypothetical protein KC320_g50 [Hortaea werneckii]